MRWLVLVALVFLASCTDKASNACEVVEIPSLEAGFVSKSTGNANVTLKVGGCIEFVNNDPVNVHLAQSKNASAGLSFATPNLLSGSREKVVFNLAGDIEYVCAIQDHARTMRGTITVLP